MNEGVVERDVEVEPVDVIIDAFIAALRKMTRNDARAALDRVADAGEYVVECLAAKAWRDRERTTWGEL